MKTCPFCAEEIQDAAIVCKHCGRDLMPQARHTGPVPPPPLAPAAIGPPKKKTHGLIWVVAISVLIFSAYQVSACLVSLMETTTLTPTERLLNITAAKGLLSCSITNRESTAIRGCRLHVKDAQGVEWSVEGTGDIEPLETATFSWSRFTAQGQPMPGEIGRGRGVYVSCLVTGLSQRLTAAFR